MESSVETNNRKTSHRRERQAALRRRGRSLSIFQQKGAVMFYDRFIALCNRDNITPSHAVKAIGIGSANATFWKHGSIPNTKNLQKLADYFHVSASYLLGESETQTITTQCDTNAETELDKLTVIEQLREIDKLPEANKAAAMRELAVIANLIVTRYKNFRPIEETAQK